MRIALLPLSFALITLLGCDNKPQPGTDSTDVSLPEIRYYVLSDA